MRLELAQLADHPRFFSATQPGQQLHDPLFMPRGHFTKALEPCISELDGEGAAVAGIRSARHKSLALELIGDPGHVAAGDHQPLGKLIHAQAASAAFQLCHEVKARQGSSELLAQTDADLVFDAHRTAQQAQPQTQRLVVAFLRAGFQIEDRWFFNGGI